MNWLRVAQELHQQQIPFAIATVYDVGGSAPREVGAKIIVELNGTIHETIGGGELEKQVIEQSRKCLKENKNGYFSYPLGAKTAQCCGGVVEVAIEIFNNFYPLLYIFGSGHVGIAITKTLKDTPLSIHIVDQRIEWLQQANSLKENKHLLGNSTTFLSNISLDHRSFCVVLTHSHDLDFDLVNELIQQPEWKYIGLIGSESKWIRFHRKLVEAGRTEHEIARITCPIGIPIPGKTPTEIAISFGAQILQELHKK